MASGTGTREEFRHNSAQSTDGQHSVEQMTRRSMGRWYILVLISLMYLITYLDRVNISTAAPVISDEFGFDKITMA
jgi:sugar phosphate permease